MSEEVKKSTVVLVACVGQKLDHPAVAADLYQSRWFKLAREYAEAKGGRWFILSALHGLVKPDQVVEPYDYTLVGKKKSIRREWAEQVIDQLREEVPPGRFQQVNLMAGRDYRDPLESYLAGHYLVWVPMRNMGIGKQLQYLKRLVKEAKGGS